MQKPGRLVGRSIIDNDYLHTFILLRKHVLEALADKTAAVVGDDCDCNRAAVYHEKLRRGALAPEALLISVT
jgi:hypothetical protein